MGQRPQRVRPQGHRRPATRSTSCNTDEGGRGTPTKRVTIGRHGALTPDQARKEATRLSGAIANGTDPAAVRAAEKAAPTVAALGRAVFGRARRHQDQAAHGGRISAADRQDHPAGARRSGCATSPAPTWRGCTTHRATRPTRRTACSRCCPRCSTSPSGGACGRTARIPAAMSRNSPSASASGCCRRRVGPLGDALATHDGSPYVVAAVKLLVFTGARLGEVLGLRWEWIDFERGEARLPDSKTGAKTLHLPPPALAVLAELPRVDGNPYVIVGHEGGRCAGQPRKAVAGDPQGGRARRRAAA